MKILSAGTTQATVTYYKDGRCEYCEVIAGLKMIVETEGTGTDIMGELKKIAASLEGKNTIQIIEKLK